MEERLTMRNKFEIFGEPVETTPEQLAETFYKRNGNDAVIPFYDRAGKTGCASEVEFQAQLSEASGATEDRDGKIPWDDLLNRIKVALE